MQVVWVVRTSEPGKDMKPANALKRRIV